MVIKTFRLRLTLIYTVVVVIMFFVSDAFMHAKFESELLDAVDRNLLMEAKTELVHEIAVERLGKDEEIIKRVGDEFYEFMNRDGEVLIASITKSQSWPLNRELMLKAFNGSAQFDTVKFKGENFRILYFPVGVENILRVGESLEEVEKSVAALKRISLIAFPFALAIAGLISWFLAGKALDPVVKIRSLAEEIRRGRLGKRIDIGLKGKEIDDLVKMFNEMLDSIQRSIETQKSFNANVSHEIRSPLTSLRGSIEVSLRKKRAPEEYEELLKRNLSDIVRLSKLTDNLMFLSRADSNIVEIRRHWFDMNQLLKTVVERLRYNALSEGLTIVEDYEEDLEYNGDGDILEQAFSNLIDNAVKYTPSGGTITVRAEREDDSIKVTISDTGAGIPEKDIPHIFERFYRVDKERSRKLGGTGLGLAITQWIINAHGGKITVQSIVGSGSDFIVVFPKAPD